VKEWREKMHVYFVVFIDLERQSLLPTYPKDKLKWRLRLIENLIKKIKEKTLGLKSKVS